ncbi:MULTISPECIES: fatty acyl-AMP ligase [Okeania]|uniref:Fatty acyl-AMP ligase n=1 Tax=Okeania hirsuta TaxID=1458930 RepID=A0A3N6PRZ8_9CYAN|nr:MULTISPECIES: fatty acyl-AMP ligase [Okeania]NES88726.1 fatty acyl-AMP ligase [Okeania sp. SIO2B9]NET74782.1 fatty acyl-AMP ligase [Okeania sp. SIO1F9]RQH51410.1 fatty acyl-AMP ligase [Okeania hirsuta]
MPKYSTILDILNHRSQNLPNQIAYTFLPDGETESGSLTYQQLNTQVQAIAAHLQSIIIPEDRILVVYPYTAGLEFIASFFGCICSGAIAVTSNPPLNNDAIVKLQERVQSSEPKAILTTESFLREIQEKLAKNPDLAPKLKDLPWIATDKIDFYEAPHWIEPKIDPDTLAFFQYTSGSTGKPKGVMVTHRNVLHNSEIIYQSFEHSPESQGVIWLPMFHDMGLIGGVIQPLYGGFPVTLMSPVALIQKPIRWLKAISQYKATTSGGPNFAYDLVSRQVTPKQLKNLDLSSWSVAFSGAEPVRAATLERFAETFAPCGFRREAFYPCYGMAETTLFISGATKTKSPLIKYVDAEALAENRVVVGGEKSRAVVSCGFAWLGDEIMIVDPESLVPRPDGEVGEIWVSGAGVGRGYWNQPEETERTFNAFLADKGPFLRTGDLGFLQDGELFITGRIKDVMILWGRYRYPQDIELTVEKCHPALRSSCGAAFSIEAEDDERLIIAQEVERSYLRKLNVEEVVGAIRQAVAEEHTVEVYAINLLKTGSIPKTTSGKIQRRVCRSQFLEGSLNVVGQWQLQTEKGSVSELAGNYIDSQNS